MSDFESKRSSFEKDTYLVALWTDLEADGADAYDYFCGDHMEALGLAISEHKMAGRPLPIGTSYLVQGPCHDACCDCGGKIRCKAGTLFPETAGRGWTN